MNMKTFLNQALGLLICVSLVSVASFAAEKEAVKPSLLISVSVPPVWDPMRESDVADAFYSRIATAMERAGYKGKIVSADRFDAAKSGTTVLEITVMRWRPERTGNVECTFSAGLNSGRSRQSLGLFSGNSPQWMTTASRTWEIRRGLEDSADAAVKDLVARLRNDGLLLPEKSRAAD